MAGKTQLKKQERQLSPVDLTPSDGNNLEKVAPVKHWSIEDSENLYRIQGWGEPYFAIKRRNIGLPLLIRFSDILEDRIERLNACFSRAIARYNYPNVYRGVYPIKCNQHRHIVESLVRFGKPYQFGLEAGSKPELMIALATLEPALNGKNDKTQPLLICNGYKDKEYIETALLTTRLGHRPLIVIEQLEELYLTLRVSRQLGIAPHLGVRAKLGTKGVGRWGCSTGDRAKFGLTVPEILTVVTELEQAGMLDCLQLLHYHIGSQISAISVIKDAIREASQIYVELAKLGANMTYLDVGGGLGVDYDGSKTNFYASKNYNMQNYANDIVAEVKEACEDAQISPPILISESGRAIASHQSVLVFDILGSSEVPQNPPDPCNGKEHLILRNLWETYTGIDERNYQEAYHDAGQFKEEAISLFNFGYLSLKERARAEQLYWACCHKILQVARQQDYVPDDLEDLEQIMASIYYANLSVFQSVPDSWAIDQLFPIMPIHRLYYLGMFLVGAYQEIMGNLHNLFGDTNVVHIQMSPKGYDIEYLVKGDTITEVLGYVQYSAEDLLERIRLRCEQALQENRMTVEESQLLLQDYERSLRRYTYLVGGD